MTKTMLAFLLAATLAAAFLPLWVACVFFALAFMAAAF